MCSRRSITSTRWSQRVASSRAMIEPAYPAPTMRVSYRSIIRSRSVDHRLCDMTQLSGRCGDRPARELSGRDDHGTAYEIALKEQSDRNVDPRGVAADRREEDRRERLARGG